jgi:hypothetical protein
MPISLHGKGPIFIDGREKKISFILCMDYIQASDPKVAKLFNKVAGMVSYVKMKITFSSQFPRNIWRKDIPCMDSMAWVGWWKDFVAGIRKQLAQDD